jgi:hypothetical protein
MYRESVLHGWSSIERWTTQKGPELLGAHAEMTYKRRRQEKTRRAHDDYPKLMKILRLPKLPIRLLRELLQLQYMKV